MTETSRDPTTPEQELVDAARAGGESAFAELVRRELPRTWGLCRAMMKSEVEAKDALQDALLSAWRRFDGYRADAPFGPWLRKVATNACLMRLRTQRRRPEAPLELTATFHDDGHWERPVVDLAPRVDALIERRELGVAIQAAIDTLPEGYRTVFVLADLEERPMKEIAGMLDMTIPNVKTRLHRARLKLREALSDHLAGAPVAPDAAGAEP